MRKISNPFSLRKQRAAFTLVELIISIGMVLILMTGIVKVFKYATDAVGAGLAVSDIVRVQRALATQIPADMAGLSSSVTSCPAILLDSQQNDPTATPAGTIATGNNGDFGVVQGPLYLDKNDQAANPSGSQFRQDSISFFSKGNFTRQTGNDGTFVDPVTSSWAWIWYGQLWLPNNQAGYALSDNNAVPTYPGAGNAADNPNNFYARQWQLGRVAMLILPKNSYPGHLVSGAALTDVISGYWPGTGGNRRFQSFINEWLAPNANLFALGFQSQSRDYWDQSNVSTIEPPAPPSSPSPPPHFIQQSRYDLVGVTAANSDPFRDYVIPWFQSATAANWPLPCTPKDDVAATGDATINGQSLNYRFQVNPYPVRSTGAGNSLVSSQAAVTVPTLASGCVRFYVEYAGDFINQNTNGTVNTFKADKVTPNPGWNVAAAIFTGTTYSPDGTDFYIDRNGIRRIRWYGLPRSVTGGVIDAVDLNGAGFQTDDVLPLAYYCSNPPSSASVTRIAPFEKLVAPFTNTFNHYICAWDPTTSAIRPTMFRITIELIDADGRLSSPRVLQYIVPVGQS